jgi:hypothetical protein
MGKAKDLMGFMNSLKCLIIFERKTSSLYEDVAEVVDSPLVRSLLLHNSLDCKKHSTVLRGIILSLPGSSWKPADLPKSLSEALRSIDDFQIAISNINAIPEEELTSVCGQLTGLADSLAAEYDDLLQLSTLELLSREMNNYKISLDTLKTILADFLHDEEYHREVLAMIVELLEWKDKEGVDNTPAVKFRNPDGWNRVAPMTG